jgi:hypothetical protein
MKWTEFLTDAELNNIERFHHLPDGEYLFEKVLHDIRECLTTYRGCVEVIVTKKDDYSATALRLLIHWDSIVADWYTQTLALSTHLGKYDSTSAEWAKHIAEVGKIVQDAAVFQAEIESIAQPETIEEAKQLIRIAKRSTATLNLLVQDIQAQNYKRLWTTLKYRDLISGDFS